jgi:phage tail sheath gpL-like
MAVPADQDLTITRGDTETLVLTITSDGTTPINITGRTYTAQIRSTPDSSTVKASFSCTVTSGSNGQVTCTLSAANSALLSAGNYFWDLQENASGVISTLLAGTVTVLADVTR